MDKDDNEYDMLRVFLDKFEDVKDVSTDLLEKTSTPASRAGHTVQRVGLLAEAGVGYRTIASQLSENSSNGFEYTPAQAEGLAMLAKDAKTNVVLTAKQTTALIRDQQGKFGRADDTDTDPSPAL